MSGSRYLENELTVLAADDFEGRAALERKMLKAAAVALKEVKAAAVSHKDVSGGSIYVGVGGVALTYIRMAQQLQRGFRYAHGSYLKKHDEKHCLKLAEQFLDDADKLMSSKRVTFLEGVSGIRAAQAVLAHMKGQDDVMNDRIKDLEGLWSSKIQGVLADDECDLLYGRAGYLYSLAWLQQQIKQDHIVSRAVIKDVIRHLLDEGMRGAQQLRAEMKNSNSSSSSVYWGLMYKWHNKRYLGAAHGLCGILYLLLHYFPLVEELDRERAGGLTGSSSYSTAVGRTVDALAATALDTGNLPTKLGDTSDERVAWCHGGAGLILLMIKASAVLKDVDGKYSAAAVAAAKDIWNRGLLKKGVGLCHGVCGNGYALLALSRESSDPHQQQQWLAAARAFGGFAAQHWREMYFTPDRPASLFEGVAGAVNFWLDVVEHHREQRWPGAEL